MPQRQTLPDRLAAVMTAKKLKQADLVKRTGLSHGYVSHILKGEKEPSRRVVADMARALGVSVTWLQEGTGEMVVAEPAGDYVLAGSWLTSIQAPLAGTPLVGAIAHTIDMTGSVERAWRELSEDRKAEVTTTLRTMASVAIVIERSLPRPIAERLINELTKSVSEYLADAF